jgi:hypothetical protein
MSDSGDSFPLVHLQFRRAKALCKRGVSVSHPKGDNTKSCAQVAPSVGQHVVRQKSCGLKPGESKPFRITARFSKDEREILVRQAEKACLTVSEYIRVSVLGPTYASSIDPEKRQLLLNLNRELSRQGTNLNQIAKHLNAGSASPEQGESMLAMLARSLLSAHKTVRHALAEGRTEA